MKMKSSTTYKIMNKIVMDILEMWNKGDSRLRMKMYNIRQVKKYKGVVAKNMSKLKVKGSLIRSLIKVEMWSHKNLYNNRDVSL